MKFRSNDTVPVAAARAGFSAATGYRITADRNCPRTSSFRVTGGGPIR